jgi:hypothetical protein
VARVDGEHFVALADAFAVLVSVADRGALSFEYVVYVVDADRADLGYADLSGSAYGCRITAGLDAADS